MSDTTEPSGARPAVRLTADTLSTGFYPTRGLRDALDHRIQEAVTEPRRRALRGEEPRPGTAGSAS